MQMIETVLDNNVFKFNGKEDMRTEGVAIGSRLGKNLFCAYMRRWDTGLEKSEKIPICYTGFINDGFGILTHSELRSTCEVGRFKAVALKEARSMVENRSNQIQYDFYL